jgi:hypothetical protein
MANPRARPAEGNASPASAPNSRRRRFLFALGASGAGAAAAAAAPAVQASVAQAAAAQPPASRGYRETEHVRDYYASTRLY